MIRGAKRSAPTVEKDDEWKEELDALREAVTKKKNIT